MNRAQSIQKMLYEASLEQALQAGVKILGHHLEAVSNTITEKQFAQYLKTSPETARRLLIELHARDYVTVPQGVAPVWVIHNKKFPNIVAKSPWK